MRPVDEGRCQLFAGHDGPHAVMFGRDGERVVRTWRSGGDGAFADTGVLQRPWMFGFPLPAWFEPVGSDGLDELDELDALDDLDELTG
jgi:hypothetical protein